MEGEREGRGGGGGEGKEKEEGGMKGRGGTGNDSAAVVAYHVGDIFGESRANLEPNDIQ